MKKRLLEIREKVNVKFIGLYAFMLSFMIGNQAFASDASSVTGIIETAAETFKGDALKVIAAAVSLGVIFFGAKLLWSQFKSMAR